MIRHNKFSVKSKVIVFLTALFSIVQKINKMIRVLKLFLHCYFILGYNELQTSNVLNKMLFTITHINKFLDLVHNGISVVLRLCNRISGFHWKWHESQSSWETPQAYIYIITFLHSQPSRNVLWEAAVLLNCYFDIPFNEAQWKMKSQTSELSLCH